MVRWGEDDQQYEHVTLAEAEMELATVRIRAAAFRAGALPSEYRDVLVTIGLAG